MLIRHEKMKKRMNLIAKHNISQKKTWFVHSNHKISSLLNQKLWNFMIHKISSRLNQKLWFFYDLNEKIKFAIMD